MSDHCIGIQKKGLVDLVKALNTCTIKNTNKFETPVKCRYNLNRALIVGVDPLAKTFTVIDQQTKQKVVVGSDELMGNFQKRGNQPHTNEMKLRDLSEITISTISPINNFTSFDTSDTVNPVGAARSMVRMNGGAVVDVSTYKNNATLKQQSDYFSASTSIEEGLCE